MHGIKVSLTDGIQVEIKVVRPGVQLQPYYEVKNHMKNKLCAHERESLPSFLKKKKSPEVSAYCNVTAVAMRPDFKGLKQRFSEAGFAAGIEGSPDSP